MAAIDKIYTTKDRRDEFYEWLKANKPNALKYMYEWADEWNDGFTHPISNFPLAVDRWLMKNCPIEWVVEYIKDQHGLTDRKPGEPRP